MTLEMAAPAPDTGPRWGRAFALALGAHLLPGAVLVGWTGPVAAPPAPPPAGIMLELAPLPSAPAVTPSEAAPTPPAVEAPPPPPEPVEEPTPEPEPVPVPKPRERPVLKPLPVRPKAEVAMPRADAAPSRPREQAEARPPASESSAPPAAAQVSDRTAAPAVGASAAQTSSSVQTWQSRLFAHLERHKRYPSRARRLRQEGVPMVRFAMDREGRLLSVRLEHPCGVDSLDEEALALVDRAQPFPPPPPEIKGDRVELVVPVDFSIRTR